MKITFVAASQSHVQAMEGRWRQADIDEVSAASGLTPAEAIREGIGISRVAYTVLFDGVPVAVFGVSGCLLGGGGAPWMIGTSDLDRHPYAMVKAARPVVKQLREWFAPLANWVDARNTHAIAWLKVMGFTVADIATPHGLEGLPFYLFVMER